jgi:fructose PTS system EIIBC or EIIC component
MDLSRYLSEDRIRLEMTTVIEPLAEGASREKWRAEGKAKVIDELVTVLEQGVRTGNRTKLILDFVNREKKATTGIGDGVAIPHIRSLQAKEFMMGFARSSQGYDFDSLDGQPTHIFFIMASPPYDDNLYLKVFKTLAGMLQYETFRRELMEISTPWEIIRAIKAMQ